jgi:hypothetical protein
MLSNPAVYPPGCPKAGQPSVISRPSSRPLPTPCAGHLTLAEAQEIALRAVATLEPLGPGWQLVTAYCQVAQLLIADEDPHAAMVWAARAETTVDTLAAQVRAADADEAFEFVLVRFDRGADWQAAVARFRRLLRPVCVTVQQSTCVVTDQQPNGITDYARIDAVPEVLGGLLAVLGLAVLSQLIVISGRRRRRDFAVLRALGLLRHQISSITAWQVSTLAVLALAAGLPLGIAAGRRGWALLGVMLGVPANAITPVSLVLLTIPGVVLLANAAAFWPGRRAARARAADVLRVE